jgi:hypothetical protein
MSPKVKPAFNQHVVVLPVDAIVPQREIPAEIRKSTTYRRISSSLAHIGFDRTARSLSARTEGLPVA